MDISLEQHKYRCQW